MKIQYLGTAAAEGIPALFCHCPMCEEARRLKGKNLRARTQAVIDEKILIDYSPDTYLNTVRFGVDLSKIKHLIVTHTHLDHFAPADLELRSSAFATNMTEKTLTVYGTKTVGEKLKEHQSKANGVLFCELKLYKPQKIDDYTVTALPARHMLDREEQAVIYLIQKNGKAILYCNDTGLDEKEQYLSTSIVDYLKQNNIKLDFIGLDCTFATKKQYDYRQHLSLEDNAVIFEKLKNDGIATENTVAYATHFSHWDMIEHEKMVELGKKFNLKIAYDGVVIQI